MTEFYIGGKKISLIDNNLLAQGGEGAVYVKNNTAYKIYLDINKCIPVGKIQELSCLTNPNIIKPQDLIFNKKNQHVGYSMRYLTNTVALCKLFTKAFKTKNNINPQKTLELVRKLQELVDHCHKNNILIVDLNELNFLISQKFNEVYAIDVDSYQTKTFPATAIMSNIRDRQVKNNKFTEGSDWFSFAVISFNMLIGIHPYKGRHPTINNWEDRMDKNVSVFDSNVSLPDVCLPFDVIPNNYRNWYKALFVDGKRLPPPIGLHDTVQLITQIKKIVGSNNFDIKELLTVPSDILSVVWNNNTNAIVIKDKIIINGKESSNNEDNPQLVYLPQRNNIISVYKKNQTIELFNLITQKNINWSVAGSDIMKYNNRIYIKNGPAIYELKFIEAGANVIPGVKQVAQVLELGTLLFSGVAIQKLLGATYVSLFPESEKHHQLHIKELNNYKIIDAKYENQVLMVIGYLNGKYDKFIFRLSLDFDKYDIRKIEDISYLDVNFTVLDNKICVHITDNNTMEIFPAIKDNVNIKEIKDPILSGDMELFSYGVQTMFVRENKIYSIKTK